MPTSPLPMNDAIDGLIRRYTEDRSLTRDDVLSDLRQLATVAALPVGDDSPSLDVELLARAMDIADPSIDDHDDEDHADHLAYAKDIAPIYAALRGGTPDAD